VYALRANLVTVGRPRPTEPASKVKAWSLHRRHISEVPVVWVGAIPQLGIVYDDLRLGLREGRSSTELRWPPAKNTRVMLTGGDVTKLAYLRQAARRYGD
jgi:hypothetical protein